MHRYDVQCRSRLYLFSHVCMHALCEGMRADETHVGIYVHAHLQAYAKTCISTALQNITMITQKSQRKSIIGNGAISRMIPRPCYHCDNHAVQIRPMHQKHEKTWCNLTGPKNLYSQLGKAHSTNSLPKALERYKKFNSKSFGNPKPRQNCL